jgi:putative acetyltransferase
MKRLFQRPTADDVNLGRVCQMKLRRERPSDAAAIRDLTTRAFAPMPYSSGTEAAIIDGLREVGQLTLSLVAEEDNAIIGHVAFSPVAIDDVRDGWYGLGPISVDPDRQRSGIGRSLVSLGLQILKDEGAKGVALVGSPEIYGRMGFRNSGLLTYQEVNPAFVQFLVLSGDPPRGEVQFSPVFDEAE